MTEGYDAINRDEPTPLLNRKKKLKKQKIKAPMPDIVCQAYLRAIVIASPPILVDVDVRLQEWVNVIWILIERADYIRRREIDTNCSRFSFREQYNAAISSATVYTTLVLCHGNGFQVLPRIVSRNHQ